MFLSISFSSNIISMSNSAVPDQMVLLCGIWSGATLFAKVLFQGYAI